MSKILSSTVRQWAFLFKRAHLTHKFENNVNTSLHRPLICHYNAEWQQPQIVAWCQPTPRCPAAETSCKRICRRLCVSLCRHDFSSSLLQLHDKSTALSQIPGCQKVGGKQPQCGSAANYSFLTVKNPKTKQELKIPYYFTKKVITKYFKWSFRVSLLISKGNRTTLTRYFVMCYLQHWPWCASSPAPWSKK